MSYNRIVWTLLLVVWVLFSIVDVVMLAGGVQIVVYSLWLIIDVMMVSYCGHQLLTTIRLENEYTSRSARRARASYAY